MKRVLTILLLLIVIMTSQGCGRKAKQIQDMTQIESYIEIPGVTAEDIYAVERLLEGRRGFTYGHTIETEAFKLPDGSYDGFVYRFCELLTELFGTTFKPEPHYEWGELMKRFEGREIDFIGELTATPERMERYYMSHTIAERSIRLYTLTDGVRINQEKDIEGLRIGALAGTITVEYIENTYDLEIDEVWFESLTEVAEKLINGEIDGFVMESVADPNFLDYSHIESRELFKLVYSPVSMSTADPELEPIIAVMNKYLAAGGIDVLYRMHREGESEYAKFKLYRSLSQEEREYIAEVISGERSVLVGLEHDNYPYSFYNTAEKEFQGIAIDVLQEISRLTGLEFKTATEKDTTWAEIFESLSAGRLSMVSQLLQSESRRDNFIWSEEPYSTSNYALVSRLEYPELAVYQVIRAKTGYSSKTVYEEMFKEWFPDHGNSVAFDSQDDGFAALERGEIDLLMTSEDMLLVQTGYRENPGFKVNIKFDTPVNSYFGFNKDEEVLCRIISKAQQYANTQTIESSWTSRTFDYSVKLANQRTMFVSVLTGCLLCVLIAMIYLLVKNNRLGKEAQVASTAKSVFLAHMSHEIRTPLNAIIGMTEIARNTISIEKKDDCIEEIRGASRHLLGIINDILDMSKIESGKLELIYDQFRLSEALGEVMNIIRMTSAEKEIELIYNIRGMEKWCIIGDKLRLSQVLINLLGNAVKFTDRGGRVELSVKEISEGDEEVKMEFSVSDNGIGMTEEQLERLFEPFEQGDGTIAVRYGGTGLGMTISRSIINMMGGEITVESKLGKGTTFTFELRFPVSKDECEATEEEERTMPEMEGRRILLVEDITVNRLIVRELMSGTGAEIDEAEDGQKAVELFRQSPDGYYDMILMDIQMPVLDGYEATTAIRSMTRKDARTVPIISMTANAYTEDAQRAEDSGMNGYLSKPVDYSALVNVMNENIIRRGQ